MKSTLTTNILDLSLKVETDNTIMCNLFNFDIVQFPDLTGCIPSKNAYGIILSQLQRYYKACSNVHDFVKNAALLIDNEKFPVSKGTK